MTTKRLTLIAASAGTLMLAACGGGSGGNASAPGGSVGTASAGQGGAWATDACKVLDKAAVGAALGTDVTEATLGMVHQPAEHEAGTSECTYALKSGGTARLMTRWSPIADNTPEAIQAARNFAQEALSAYKKDKKLEDVAGVGKAAFWVPGLQQLNVFVGEDRFVTVSLGNAPEDKAKDIAVGLAKKAGA